MELSQSPQWTLSPSDPWPDRVNWASPVMYPGSRRSPSPFPSTLPMLFDESLRFLCWHVVLDPAHLIMPEPAPIVAS
jgi:hypothetical protein